MSQVERKTSILYTFFKNGRKLMKFQQGLSLTVCRRIPQRANLWIRCVYNVREFVTDTDEVKC